jgi:hypothetical protein
VLAEVSSGVESRDSSNGFRECEDDAAIDEASYVGYEDLLGDVPPSISKRVKDSASLFHAVVSACANRAEADACGLRDMFQHCDRPHT